MHPGHAQVRIAPHDAEARLSTAICDRNLQANGVSASDVDLVIAHQANLRILEAVAEGTGLALERFHLSIERYGNKRW